ncbi:MAG: DNA internalization-related competence protein ComEC/Rec2 [Bacilli bacterium]|nr:DNA internalization-related competence protein ComEC/Rec2 [Bacilli bacterium]
MKKLKNILQCNYIFYILLVLSLIYLFIFINFIIVKSEYKDSDKNLYGTVIDYKKSKDKTTIWVKGKEKVLVNYYSDINVSYGDYIYVYGVFKKPKENGNFNLFNYKRYLLSNKINYVVTASKITIIKKNDNVFYTLKNNLLKRIESANRSKGYILAFLYADKSLIEKDIYTKYQKIGVSHLFAVSGMHVSLISIVLLKLLNKIKERKRYIIVSIFLSIYLFLTNFTISMVRATFQFILFFINKSFKLNIDNSNLVLFLFSILVIINPYNIYNIGFLFSFIISFTLIRCSKLIKGKFIIKSLKISLISFFSSMPVLINNFFEVNFLGIILNIIYIPFVSYILFPLSLVTVLFPSLDNILYMFISCFEKITDFFSNIKFLSFPICKMNIFLIIIYYIIFIYILKRKKKLIYKIIIVIISLIFLINNGRIVNNEVSILDVGQGDSSLIRLKNKNILIDTGGNINYDISKNILIPYFKSVGIKKIDYLVLTHGDYDHMGEAINLVENFKVEKVIFNCGPYNDLEQELIKVLDKKKIKYYSCIKELNIDNNKLYFLQTKEYDNENDNSNVIYSELNVYKFMFMGDASVTTEKEIMNKYNLPDIDVLKVGHHGSKTSSSKGFINVINPKYSIISVGKNNRYGHPNKEVLENLENSKIYRTDLDGSIMFKIKNNELKIETCSP